MSDPQNEEKNLTYTKKLGILQFEFYCKSQPQLCNLIYKLQNLLKQTPQFYYRSILLSNKGRHVDSVQRRLRNQIQKFTQGKSFYHTVKRSIQAREKCIEKIRLGLRKVQKALKLFKKHYTGNVKPNHQGFEEITLQQMEQTQRQQGYQTIQTQQTIQKAIKILQQLFTDMSRLRDISVYIVETVHKWKLDLQQWSYKCGFYEEIKFMTSNNEDIYEKILQDLRFLWWSKLAQYIYFETENDPFLIRNVIKVNDREQKTILEKYFLQFLLPKSQHIIDKCIDCYEMLVFKYTPEVDVQKKEQQQLIQNYLRQRNQQLQQEGIYHNLNDYKQQLKLNDFKQQLKFKDFKQQLQWQYVKKKGSLQNNNKFTSMSQVFNNKLKKPAQERIRQLVQRHQHRITFTKPNQSQDGDMNKFTYRTNYIIKNIKAIQHFEHAKLGLNREYFGHNSEYLGRNSLFLSRFGLTNEGRNNQSRDKNLMTMELNKLRVNSLHEMGRRAKSEKRILPNNRQFSQKNRNEHKDIDVLLTPVTHKQIEHNTKGSINKPLLKSMQYKQNIHPMTIYEHPSEHQHLQAMNKQQPQQYKQRQPQEQQYQQPQEKQQQQLQKQPSNQSALIESKQKQFKAKINQNIEIFNKEKQISQDNLSQEKLLQQNTQQKIKTTNENDQFQKEKNKNQNQNRLSAVRELISIYSANSINNHQKPRQHQTKTTLQNYKLIPISPQITNSINNQKSHTQSRPTLKQGPKTNNQLHLNKARPISMPKSQTKLNINTNQSKIANRQKSLTKLKEISKPKMKEKTIQEKTSNKSSSFINLDHEINNQKKAKRNTIHLPDDKILLRPKSIPYDMVSTYMMHIFNRFNLTSKKFSFYSLETIVSKLQNPQGNQCLLFQILSDKKGLIGHVILSEQFSKVEKKLIYKIQLINVSVFELFISSLIKITEEFLLTTPCESIKMKIYEDKMDPVSVHFVDLIENSLQNHVRRYGEMTITEGKTASVGDVEMVEKQIIFSHRKSDKKLQQLKMQSQKLMGNYRSLRFDIKCVVLGSNFRLRSKESLRLKTISGYDEVSLGYLYLRILAQVMTKRHLKQVKELLAKHYLNQTESEGDFNTRNINLVAEQGTQSLHLNKQISLPPVNMTRSNLMSSSQKKSNNIEFIRTSVVILLKYLHYLQQLSPQKQQLPQTDKQIQGKKLKQTSQSIDKRAKFSPAKQQIPQKLAQQLGSERITLTKFTHMPELINYMQYKRYLQYFNFGFLQQSRFLLNHELYLSEMELSFGLQFLIQQSVSLILLNNYMHKPVKYIEENFQEKRAKCVILPTTQQNIQLLFMDGKYYETARNKVYHNLSQNALQSQHNFFEETANHNQQKPEIPTNLFSYLYHCQQSYFKQNILQSQQEIEQIAIPKIHLHKTHNVNNGNITMFQGLFKLFPQRQFYSAHYFKTHNLWQSYFPPAVVHHPQKNSIVFQYPLIVGVMDSKSKQILTAFLLTDQE